MPAGEELRAAPRLAGPSFILSGGLCGAQRAIHRWETRQAPPPGRPALLPGQQPQEVTWAPRPPALGSGQQPQGLPGVFLPPQVQRAANAQGFTSGHAPPHASSVNFRGGLPDPPVSAPPPQDSRHLSPEFLQKWGVSHTLAEKGSHLPPRRCGVLGLRASPRASPVCSLPLDLCVCAPQDSRSRPSGHFPCPFLPAEGKPYQRRGTNVLGITLHHAPSRVSCRP